MRILHLGKFYPPAPGGIETHLRTLAVSQARLGARVEVLCVNHADEAGDDVTFSRFRRTPSRVDRDEQVVIRRAGRLASIARLDVCPGIHRELTRSRHDRPDIVHLHTPNATMLLALAAFNPGPAIVVTHHSDIVRQRFLRHALTPFERVVYGRARRVLATSPAYLGGSPTLRRHEKKVDSLPLGIDLAPFLAPSATTLEHERAWKPADGAPLWLMVGRLIYYKGLSVALAALRETPGRLLIIGTGPLERESREHAARLGVADRVIWRGHAADEEVQGAYRAATALWFPSIARSEGFGMVQVEAMASRCPVINTAIPHSGVAWVCPHGEAGLTVPVGDASAFAAAANTLASEPGLRDRLGDEGRRRAVAMFSQERMAERSLEIYQEALN
jgi:rhamnosyl/mannosyltransferase